MTPDSPMHRSYRALLEQADHVTQDREILLAVQIDERRAWARAARDARLRQLDKSQQAEAILVRELRRPRRSVHEAGRRDRRRTDG
jgi:hypothetical protein